MARARPLNTTEIYLQMVAANRRGERTGMYSVCSANRYVLAAAMSTARRDGSPVLIESTCNQVNQFGGYTGMTPADFRRFIQDEAAGAGLAENMVLIGGDHLGPYPWRHEPADSAMTKAATLVRDCVAAGYTKLHLDASPRCADDPLPAPDERTVAQREAQLCRVAEEAWARLPQGAPRPVYVIGTEVPVPGGEQADQSRVAVTAVDHVRETLAITHEAFAAAGVGDAWERVIALVVQPGVEFGDEVVHDYDRASAAQLSSSIVDSPWPIVFEAHSTDYQTPRALRQLVEDHFAILKVGPALTFALREALFALEAIERELAPLGGWNAPSRLRKTLEAAMRADPQHWRPYYAGTAAEQRLARAFSYSDRARYYWPVPEVAAAAERLLVNLSQRPLPLTLLSQYLPHEYAAVRAGHLTAQPEELLRAHVSRVIDAYADACGQTAATSAAADSTDSAD